MKAELVLSGESVRRIRDLGDGGEQLVADDAKDIWHVVVNGNSCTRHGGCCSRCQAGIAPPIPERAFGCRGGPLWRVWTGFGEQYLLGSGVDADSMRWNLRICCWDRGPLGRGTASRCRSERKGSMS